jgi:DNA-directed RNA polymerase I subunit RPA49
MASHQTLGASPAPSSSSKKKKKHSKKRRAIEEAVGASSDPVDVTVDASFAGAAAPAPVVGYFPTGYDPLAAQEPPSARLFRHEKHHNRVELVVSAPGKGPDFVGRSYAGEAAAPQLCGYALGVLDKASGTLRIVPIASNKVSVSVEWFSFCLNNSTDWSWLS